MKVVKGGPRTWSLREAKDMVDGAPVDLKANVKKGRS